MDQTNTNSLTLFFYAFHLVRCSERGVIYLEMAHSAHHHRIYKSTWIDDWIASSCRTQFDWMWTRANCGGTVVDTTLLYSANTWNRNSHRNIDYTSHIFMSHFDNTLKIKISFFWVFFLWLALFLWASKEKPRVKSRCACTHKVISKCEWNV